LVIYFGRKESIGGCGRERFREERRRREGRVELNLGRSVQTEAAGLNAERNSRATSSSSSFVVGSPIRYGFRLEDRQAMGNF